ncbi:MAG: alpha/beta hydrolase [Bacteroidota bacterium]
MKNSIIISLLFACSLLSCQDAFFYEKPEVIYIRRDGADMPAYIYGNTDSKVLVLIVHGGPGGNGLEYRSGSWAEAMEQDYGMVYWDQRGQGSSQGNYDERSLNIGNMVEDLHFLVQTLKAHYGADYKIFMLGHSWGGTLTASYVLTEDYQNELAGWLEVDGAHDLPLLNRESIIMYRTIGQAELDKGGDNTDRWQEIVDFANGVDINNITDEESGQINSFGFEAEGMLEDVFQPDDPPTAGISHFLFGSPTNPLTSFLSGNATNSALNDEIEATALTDQFNRLEIPVIYLWGKYDFVVPPALAFSAFNWTSSPDKELVIFEHSGHSPMSNEPELFTKAVKDFVEKHR